jgi:uncharacterized protein (UPF0548 family)
MFSLQRPDQATIERFLKSQQAENFSYSAVGSTRDCQPPAGYVIDRTAVRLGAGERMFQRGREALNAWQQFDLGWVQAFSPPGAEPGQSVAVLAWAWGGYWLNACRVVYLVREDGPVARSGFAYGTLPEHAEKGEERFTVEWDRADDAVWYRIVAISRPNQLLAWLGYPLIRRLQRRFAADSAAAMLRAVAAG